MKKFPFPIKLHSGLTPVESQKYADTSKVKWYHDNGINILFHNGGDYILKWGGKTTYGSELIAVFDGTIVKNTFDFPMSTKGNGLTLESDPFVDDDGIKKIIQVVYWHNSKNVITAGRVKKGETIALVGNSGLVDPKPTFTQPFNGAHVHFMVFVYHWINNVWVLQEADNGVGGAQDPMKFINLNEVVYGKDAPENDLPAFQWAVSGLVELIRNFIKGRKAI